MSKYNAKPVEIDGIRFDSMSEGYRYSELKLLQRAGEIRGFHLQPSFRFNSGVRYRPDFIIFGKDGSVWCEDAKSEGTITAVFRVKYKTWRNEYPYLELRVVDKYGNRMEVV